VLAFRAIDGEIWRVQGRPEAIDRPIKRLDFRAERSVHGLDGCRCGEACGNHSPSGQIRGACGGDSAKWPVHHPEVPTMKTKTTTTSAKKARTGKTATTKRTLVTQKPLSRSRRASSQAMADKAGAMQTSAPRGLSKKATIEALVARREGAVIAELIAATGWQEHSIRAALTGLRKAGHTIARVRDDSGVARYRSGGAA
jgi:hypothetical protein